MAEEPDRQRRHFVLEGVTETKPYRRAPEVDVNLCTEVANQIEVGVRVGL